MREIDRERDRERQTEKGERVRIAGRRRERKNPQSPRQQAAPAAPCYLHS